MTDMDRFEVRLQARLTAHVARAGESLDALGVARSAIGQARSTGGVQPFGLLRAIRPDWGRSASRPPARRVVVARAFAVALISAALVGAGVILVASAPDQSPSPPGSPNPATAGPSRTPTATDGQTSPATFSPPSRPPGAAISGTFEATGSLHEPRTGHAAVLLGDGRVLVLGGGNEPESAPAPEIFDPATGTFTSIDAIPLVTHRADVDVKGGFSATLLADGRVLIAGGRVGSTPTSQRPLPPTAAAVVFDPVTGRATSTGSMTVARAEHAAVLLPDGRVLIAGGAGITDDGGEASLASAELYDPATGQFTPAVRMPWDRADSVATVLPSGRVAVSGGASFRFDATGSGSSQAVERVALYDPATGEFDQIPSVRWPESGTLLMLGGDRVHRLDLATGDRLDITPQPWDVVEEFGSYCRDLPVDCRYGMTTTLLTDGRVLLAGGSTVVLNPLNPGGYTRVPQTWGEVLEPVSRRVVLTGLFAYPRSGHTATLLDDGRVVLIGGSVLSMGPDLGVGPTYVGAAELFSLAP